MTRLRAGLDDEVRGDEGEDLLEMDMQDGEEEDFGPSPIEEVDEEDEGMEEEDEEADEVVTRKRGKSVSKSPAIRPVDRRSGSGSRR